MNKCLLFLCTFLLISCSSAEPDKIRISVLRGPSALAFAQWMENEVSLNGRQIELSVIDSPEAMQALLIRNETEIAVLPTINAANLYNKGINYPMIGCTVWGNLYLVEQTGIEQQDKEIYIFGSGTTPDILTRHYCEQQPAGYTYNYSFKTVGEMVQALLSGQAKRAVLAEPYLSMVLEKDTTFRILANLNQSSFTQGSFPQTAVLLHPSLLEEKATIDSLLNLSTLFTRTQPLEAIRIVEEQKIFPANLLTPASIERCRIEYRTTEESQTETLAFQELILRYEPRAIGGKIPDTNFLTQRP